MKIKNLALKLFISSLSILLIQSCVPNGGGANQNNVGNIKNIFPSYNSYLNMYKQIKPTYSSGKLIKIDYSDLNGVIVKSYNVTRSESFIYINYTPRNGYGIQNTLIEVLPERPNFIKRIVNSVQIDANTYETDTVIVEYNRNDSIYLVSKLHTAKIRKDGITIGDYEDLQYNRTDLIYYNLHLKYCNALAGNCVPPITYENIYKPTNITYSDSVRNRIGIMPPFVEFNYLLLEMLNLSYGTEPSMMVEYKKYDGTLHYYSLTLNEEKRIKQMQNLITYF